MLFLLFFQLPQEMIDLPVQRAVFPFGFFLQPFVHLFWQPDA